MRPGAIAGLLMVLLGACAGGPEQRVCYEVYESPTTEFGSRALRAVPCPQDRDG